MRNDHYYIVLAGGLLLSSCSANEEMEDRTEDDLGADLYQEPFRAQYHYSSPKGNLADPNGLIYYEGEYHLFHQQDGNWAHAISDDLIHWESQPLALEHDELGLAMSGSAIVDWDNTSQLFEDGQSGLIAFYTNTEGGEAQSLAYSGDNGRSWERYEGNPVIPNTGEEDFRDPAVFWHEESERWVMAVSTGDQIAFYHSENLLDWTYASEFKNEGLQVAVWETPELFSLPVVGTDEEKWVLHVSVGNNPDTEGSTAEYFIGDFDGETFTNEKEADTMNITDYGQDFYAAQTFANMDDRTVWLAWMDNWAYPYAAPTEPWQGTMSIPRELKLMEDEGAYTLAQEPVSELERLREEPIYMGPLSIEDETTSLDFNGTNYEFVAELSWEELNEFAFNIRTGESEHTAVGVDVRYNKAFVDRTENGLDEIENDKGDIIPFGKRFETDFDASVGNVTIRGFVDESSVEVFIDDGENVFSNLIYPDEKSDRFEVMADGKLEVESLIIYPMKGVWEE